jgi:hypothetical protein
MNIRMKPIRGKYSRKKKKAEKETGSFFQPKDGKQGERYRQMGNYSPTL